MEYGTPATLWLETDQLSDDLQLQLQPQPHLGPFWKQLEQGQGQRRVQGELHWHQRFNKTLRLRGPRIEWNTYLVGLEELVGLSQH